VPRPSAILKGCRI